MEWFTMSMQMMLPPPSLITPPPGWTPRSASQRLESLMQVLPRLKRAGMGRIVSLYERTRLSEGTGRADGGLLVVPKVSALLRVYGPSASSRGKLEIAADIMKAALQRACPKFRDCCAEALPQRSYHPLTQELIRAEGNTEGDFMALPFNLGTLSAGHSPMAAEAEMEDGRWGVPAHEVAGLAFAITDPNAFNDESSAMAFGGTYCGPGASHVTMLLRREGTLFMDYRARSEGHTSLCLPYFPMDMRSI